jgi:6-phosphogluconolactonase
MKINRRHFLSAIFCLLITIPATPQMPNKKFQVLVGTYTDKTGSKGIYAFDFDASTGKLTPRGLAVETPNPSWVLIHPNGKWAYAANESGKQSMVSAFSIVAQSAKLTLLNQLSSQGEDPCHLAFDKSGKFLFAANYTSGHVAVFPILPDGKLGQPTAVVKDAGTVGPNPKQQDGPHAHWVAPTVNGGSFYVADLGLDRVLRYEFDETRGTLSVVPMRNGGVVAATDLSAKLAPGTGPRHVAFSPDGLRMYVLGELKSTVTAFSGAGLDAPLSPAFQEISALPKGFSGRNDAAEIAMHPTGKFLFTSNRGADTIAVFNVNPKDGRLKLTASVPTGGKEPRHFALDPTGQFLLAENQNSNSIVVFRINPTTGALTEVSRTDDIPSPVCLMFLP